jgi:hypothetical protein
MSDAVYGPAPHNFAAASYSLCLRIEDVRWHWIINDYYLIEKSHSPHSLHSLFWADCDTRLTRGFFTCNMGYANGTRKIIGCRQFKVEALQIGGGRSCRRFMPVLNAVEGQALYACPERSRREPPTSAAFLAWLHLFNWFSRPRAEESDSCPSVQTNSTGRRLAVHSAPFPWLCSRQRR